MEPPPAAIAEAVSQELLRERVLWSARPDRWAYASRYWKTALFGIPFAGFAVFWTFQASQIPSSVHSGFAAFFPIWGLLFVAFGLSMLLSPIWAAWTAGTVYYVVTERRAVIFEKKLRLNIQSFSRAAVSGYDRVSHGGPGGNIIFQRIADRSGRGTRVKEIGFFGLADYAVAEQALNKLLAANAS